MQNVKNTMIDRMLALVAPHLCCGCGEVGKNLCDNCKYDIVSEPYAACIDCGRPESNGICLNHGASFQKAWIGGERKGVLQRLIGNFKFQNMKTAVVSLADILDARLPTLPGNTVIVPIPTAPSHVHERGYDHLDLIVRRFASLRTLPIAYLLRRVDGASQHHANREMRFQQVLSAFVVEGEIDPTLTYLILDDVITTGATIHRAADLLHDAGAQTMWVAAIARQPSTDHPTSVKIVELATNTQRAMER